MRKSMAGDGQAYRLLLASIAPYLRGLARNRCRQFGLPHSDAEEIVQEVLLVVHLKRNTWDQNRPVGPWLAAIAHNKITDAIRHKKRHVDVPLDEVLNLEAADNHTDALEALYIEQLIACLNSRQREIVNSIVLLGENTKETANRLGMTEGATRVALHRALKAIEAHRRSKSHENQ